MYAKRALCHLRGIVLPSFLVFIPVLLSCGILVEAVGTVEESQRGDIGKGPRAAVIHQVICALGENHHLNL